MIYPTKEVVRRLNSLMSLQGNIGRKLRRFLMQNMREGCLFFSLGGTDPQR